MSSTLRVALPVPLPQLFDYLLDTDQPTVRPGCRVLVPFGRGRRVGVVVEAGGPAQVETARLKPILRVLDREPLFDDELRATLAWAAQYWLGAPGEVYANAMPGALRAPREAPQTGEEGWRLTAAGREVHAAGSRRGRSRQLLARLAEGACRIGTLNDAVPGWRDAARRLAAAGLVERCRMDVEEGVASPQPAPPLLADQQQAVAAVSASLGHFAPFLLDGVTGSGKTEVYLALIERALAAARQVLLLVPEIGLAPQTLRRLRSRLGIEIDVLHSNLSDGARMRAWMRAHRGEARVIVGTRSAAFAPLPAAGLIIVDEEHDGSYKQQDGFRYHARDLAVYRARALDVPIVLGSATPSLETLANVEAGRYRRLHLPARAGRHAGPQV
jgi:primosomal protein N' (replication factor Y) (superfamily II helicase)